ncbi:MAG: phage head closure protein [Phycisphaerae bacterium]|nr:phage head closure protein [Phycisphaerae bacterium]
MIGGKLRHPVTIEQQSAGSPNAYGERDPSSTWSTFASVWADVSPISGREFEFARTFANTVSHRVTIRYLPGLLPSMRVNFGGRYFDINAVINTDERNYEHRLFCTEFAPES